MAGGLAKASMNLNRLGDAAKRFGAIGAAATGAMVIGLAKIINETKKLDDALRNLSAKLGTDFNGKTFAGLETEIRELGRTTSFTTTQVAELATVLAQGGKSADQIKVMTKSMLDLSRAMSEGTAESAKIAQAAMDAYGLSVEDSRRAADVLSYTVNKSNQQLVDLGEANNYVAATSRDAGISIERTSAMLAVMANNGIRGSRAGVQLRAALLQLTTKGQDTAKALDIKLTEPTGEFRDFAVVLDEFRTKTFNMTDVRRFELYKKAFGKVGISAATILGRSRKEVDAFTRDLEQSFGTAEKAADDMDAGIGGAFRMLYSAAEALWLGVGDKLTPAVEAFTRKFTNVLKDLGNNTEEIAAGIIKVLKTLMKATGALFALAVAASAVSTLFASLLVAMGATKVVLGTATSAVAGLSSTTIVLGKVFAQTFRSQHAAFFGLLSKGVSVAGDKVSQLTAKTVRFAKSQMLVGKSAKIAMAQRKRASAKAARSVRHTAEAAKKAHAAEVSRIKARNAAMRKSNLRAATKNANAMFADDGVKLSARQVAGMPTAGGKVAAAKMSDLGKGGKVAPKMFKASDEMAKASKNVADAFRPNGKLFTPAKMPETVANLTRDMYLKTGLGGSNAVTADSLTAGMSKGSSGLGGTIQRTGQKIGPQIAAQNKKAAAGKSALGFARDQFANMNARTMQLLPKSADLSTKGVGLGTKIATGMKSGLAKGLKGAPKLIFTGLKVGVKTVFTSVAAIGLTLAEAVIIGFTGSEAQAAYGLAGDFLSGAMFTGIANGMKAGGAEIARGLLYAFEFASAGDWASAWASIKMSIELGWRELMHNMSDGVKVFVDALNNFQSGSFVTFLRTIWRGFTSLASILGEVIDGVVYMLSLGNVSNFTGADFGMHMDDMKTYDDKLDMNKGNTFFNNNEDRLQQLQLEKNAQKQKLANLKKNDALADATNKKKTKQMSMEERWDAKQRKMQQKGEEKTRNIKKAAFRQAQADAAQAVLKERQAKQAALMEDLKALGLVAKVEADAESGRESAKYSKMSEVTRQVTNAGIGGLGGEGVMRQFAEKQNDVHKQNLDSQHRQESELRLINVQLKKHALESLLLKP
jgi:TP901 family phage tail tape measure protein